MQCIAISISRGDAQSCQTYVRRLGNNWPAILRSQNESYNRSEMRINHSGIGRSTSRFARALSHTHTHAPPPAIPTCRAGRTRLRLARRRTGLSAIYPVTQIGDCVRDIGYDGHGYDRHLHNVRRRCVHACVRAGVIACVRRRRRYRRLRSPHDQCSESTIDNQFREYVIKF